MSKNYTYKINNKFELDPLNGLNINIELKESLNHILIMPLILSIPNLYRDVISLVHKDIVENLKNGDKLDPIVVLSSLSWLDSLDDEYIKEETLADRIQKFIKTRSYCSFLFNSSVWIHFVELEYIDNKIDWEKTKANYQLVIDHIERIKILKIYDNPNAKEYLEYHLRLQEVNFLLDKSISSKSSGHGRHISPTLYSNEKDLRDKIEINDELDFLFTQYTNESGDFLIKGVVIRILLVDDKIGNQLDCKAKLIKDLLELKFEPKEKGQESIRDNVCWRTPLEDEDTVTIFKSDQCANCTSCKTLEKRTQLDNHSKKITNQNIEIYTAQNLKQAQNFLSNEKIRFDLIMMDYLLEKKDDGTNEREYATDFWSNGKEKYFEISLNKLNKKVKSGRYSKAEIVEYGEVKVIYDKIKANRGPLQRLWIFPITAFNQTFIDDLRNRGVRLIDYYWFLSRGADPINTPYLFLNSLNKFLQLQLENAIFSKEEINGFLRKSIDRLSNVNTLYDFTAFMGSEYTVFVEKYMSRPVIYRDMQAGSLFANYVWYHFYGNSKYLTLFKLIQHIHKFYHRCAFGTSADFDKMVLFWRELKLFISEENSLNMLDLNIDKFFNKMIEIQNLR